MLRGVQLRFGSVLVKILIKSYFIGFTKFKPNHEIFIIKLTNHNH